VCCSVEDKIAWHNSKVEVQKDLPDWDRGRGAITKSCQLSRGHATVLDQKSERILGRVP